MIDERREGRPTAYVLEEMTAEEKAAFEAELSESAELRAEVEEIREMAAFLEREMASEKAALRPEVRGRIEAAAGEKAKDDSGAKVIAIPAKKRRLGRAMGWLAAAAVLALSVGSLTFSMKRGAPDAAAVAPAEGAGYWPLVPANIAASATAASNANAAPVMDLPQSARMRGEAFKEAQSAAGTKPGAKARNVADPRAALSPGEPSSAGNQFDSIVENAFKSPLTEPLSTFSIDVDTASYSLVRTYLQGGSLPPPAAVRIEEMVNYFGYAYPEPDGDVPFKVSLDLGVAPWAPEHRLVRVGLKGKVVTMAAMDGVNLVFLVDTSGSMNEPNKLPLLKQGFRMLVDKLRPNDRVAIVAYAGSAGLVLPSTPVSDKGAVLAALDRLSSGGSTNGGAGIDLAYKVAAENYLRGGVNRVILATDGDFNVGTTSQGALVDLIQEKAKSGVFLSVLGFGMGNLNDSLLEKIADKGNGQYAYVDNEAEAKRALVDGLGGLITIAKDVKIQIEMNPAEVAGYRLIGYENRAMAAQDFNDDKKDAGELGSGHTVTALYEIVPKGGAVPDGGGLKYQVPAPSAGGGNAAPGELMTVKLRYKEPEEGKSKLLEEAVRSREVSLSSMPADFKFAAAVASFGMLLRGSRFAGNATYASVVSLAEGGVGDDAKRREFVELVRKAASIAGPGPVRAPVRRKCDPNDPLCAVEQ